MRFVVYIKSRVSVFLFGVRYLGHGAADRHESLYDGRCVPQ